jgi:phosphonate transport system substrate-binding protein
MTDAGRRRFCLAGALALAGLGEAGAAGRTVRLGLMPVYSIRALATRYEPLRAYLAGLLGQAVRVESAPDFRRYLEALLASQFDVAVAAAHFARIAQLDAGWTPLIQFEPDHDTLLVTRKGAAPVRVADLAGQAVAVIDRLAITVMGALHHLERQGLRADVDYRVVEHRTHASVVHSLLSGGSALAVTTTHGLHQLAPDQRARIEIWRSVSDIPAFVAMASPALPGATLARLRDGLRHFHREPAGSDFMARNSYTGLHAADEDAMRRADPFLKETRRMVARK